MKLFCVILVGLIGLAGCGDDGTDACLVTTGKAQKRCGDDMLPCLCGISFSECHQLDGSVYSMDCANDDDGTMTCDCLVDDTIESTFTDEATCLPESPSETAKDWLVIANEGCGWKLSLE